MKRLLLIFATIFLAQPALAFHCPADMSKIDAALASGPSLSTEQLAKVKQLRATGEQLHKSGNHADSVATLQLAMEILGIS